MSDIILPSQILIEQIVAVLPRLGVAALVLVLGLVLAFLTRRLTRWAVQRSGVDALAERAGVSRVLYAVGYKRGFADALSSLVFFAALALTLSVVAEIAGLPGVAEGLAALVQLIPRIIAAGVVVIGGLIAADVLRNLVMQVASNRDDLDSPGFVAQVAYYSVVIVSFTLGAEYLGLETGLVDALIQLVAGAGLFSLGLAFALGSRETFKNVIARHYVQRMLQPGDRVRVGDVEGTVIRHGPLVVWLRTPGGRAGVPCARLVEQGFEVQDPISTHDGQPQG